ncbi:hypothetical protein ASD65_00890 [Microbacterium sp. Root61]|uniref:hypothetical protein n=1 Tax=Microbacterium sp. Root61 TaxID=1736570 RepID=UPI0006F620C4|nr:hypothetical protein [Microbacterium sp. Root61]KRA23132.1 hypothetical protein ASD65_00890 [Microbacterium sp. Root61]
MSSWLSWRRVAAIVAAGIVTTGTLWLFGVAPGFAVAFGALAMVAILTRYAYGGVRTLAWDAEPPHQRPGTRSEIMQLSWSMRNVRGTVGDAGLRRLRSFARARLTRLGYDLDADTDRAALLELLGAEAYGIITDPRTHPRLPAVERSIILLDGLSVSPEGH